ncbi:MAG: cation:proton antiporter [Rhodoferax sp.]|nr:cation:proton antiporter [Rhodoferax sp.]MDP3655149.1 cation:proton antiporter [Rhodoferax sp.]
MTSPQWFLLIGALLLLRGLSATLLKRLPVTPAIIYLAVGLLVGPSALNLFHFNPLKESALLQALTEVAVLISLFSAGVKMPAPFSFALWRAPLMLATVSIALSVALVAAFAFYLLGLPLGACVLLGAIVAPTDPVLATDVQIRHPGDRDQLRFTLTCEAGMNDGSAFPFVMLGLGLLGLHGLGDWGLRWVAVEVVWATVSAVIIGAAAGIALARLGWKLRREPHQHELLDDFLGLGLIGVVYGLCVLVDAWGFLAVFFAAVALRQTEQKLAKKTKAHGDDDPPPKVSEGALVFKEHLERLSEMVLVILVGGTLFVNSWTWAAVGLALFLFLVARPVSVIVGLVGTDTVWRIRGLAAWFGVRGVGSLYYLMFAIQHGLTEPLALQLTQLTLIVVTLSILLHGASVKPLMAVFWRRSKPRR